MSELNDQPEFLVPTVREVQQMFAELLSHGEDITWDLLSANQEDILKSKLNEFKGHPLKMFGLPNMFQNIWSQRKFTNGQSLTSLFFVMIVDTVSEPQMAEESRSWYLYPVFRCRRCVDNSGQNNSSLDCCMTYVWHNNSIETWDRFIQHARWRPGFIVTPNRGVYKLIDGKVELRTYFVRGEMCGISHFISPKRLVEGKYTAAKNESILGTDVGPLETVYLRDKILYQLLILSGAQKAEDATELSESLLLFTHSVNNFRLASSMIKEQSFRSILGNRLKSIFQKISEETKRIEGTVDIIRSVNEVPTSIELNEFFKTRRLRKRPVINEVHSNVPVDVLQVTKIQVEEEEVNLEDYGSAVIENIESPESFEDLITNMAEHLEPEMFKLILELTQSFMEKTREDLWQLLKYHFSTETVLYQIILCVMKQHPNLDYNEVRKQFSDILSRVRYYFASANPNTFPELLQKCPKCVGYYHIKVMGNN
ncbi:uncharacterized protein [Drosophila takahashii]|uniref:uncharacterized protein isoform X2 n=1 Tax=Drosophila takahashii TaxID=29030 RepID=UPI003898D5B8